MKKKCELIASIIGWVLFIVFTLVFLAQCIKDVRPWWHFAIVIGVSIFIKVVLDCIKMINYPKFFIACFLKSLIRFCEQFSIYYYLKWICIKLFKGEQEPDYIAGYYVLFFVFFIMAGLVFWMNDKNLVSCVIMWIAIYRLFDIMVKAGKIIFIDSIVFSNNNGSSIFLPTRNPERWIILIIINIWEIMVCFAVLYFYWDKNINDPITAMYQSIQTLTTPGNGHITDELKIIFIFQHVYYVIFVLLVAPRIFSLIRTKK